MGLREIEATLPPGYRFYPSDEELVCYYLHKKVANEGSPHGTLMVVNLHTCEPWQLPDEAKLSENEWYFFNFRNRKYATGVRANRATTHGYWKATGKDRAVINPRTQELAGMRKTLVFYLERAPKGKKTCWVMHEFRLQNRPHTPPEDDWVLCRVYNKSKYSSGGGHESSTFFSLNVDPDQQKNVAGSSSPYVGPSPPSMDDRSMNRSRPIINHDQDYHQDRIPTFMMTIGGGSQREDISSTAHHDYAISSTTVLLREKYSIDHHFLPFNNLLEEFPDHDREEVDETGAAAASSSMIGLTDGKSDGDDLGFLLQDHVGQAYDQINVTTDQGTKTTSSRN